AASRCATEARAGVWAISRSMSEKSPTPPLAGLDLSPHWGQIEHSVPPATNRPRKYLAACQILLRSGHMVSRTATHSPRWQRRGPHRRRQEILHAARKLFSERSYASVSTTEIAREAGIARGLLNHYFGTTRELYLEVVRGMMRMPSNPIPLQEGGPGIEIVIEQSVDRWLTMVERNRGT